MNVEFDGATLGFALKKTIKQISEELAANPKDLGILRKMEAASRLAYELPFHVIVWRAQNRYYQLLQEVYPEILKNAQQGDAQAAEWVHCFVAIGKNLCIRIDESQIGELRLAS